MAPTSTTHHETTQQTNATVAAFTLAVRRRVGKLSSAQHVTLWDALTVEEAPPGSGRSFSLRQCVENLLVALQLSLSLCVSPFQLMTLLSPFASLSQVS